MQTMATRYEKMSKSRNNVITPDEIVHGVMATEPGFEFRTINGYILEPTRYGIWRNVGGDGCYYTSSRCGKTPVFLCQVGDPRACVLLINGQETVQHPEILASLPD